MEEEKDSEDGCSSMILVVVLWFVSSTWSAFVLATLYRWFVVPLGAVEIGLWQMLGLRTILFQTICAFYMPKKSSDPFQNFFMTVALNLMFLIMGAFANWMWVR